MRNPRLVVSRQLLGPLGRELAIPFLNWHVLLLRSDLHNIILPLNLRILFKIEKQVWVTKSFAYDNNSLVTFYSIKNSMISGKRDFIFAELAKLLWSVLCYSFFS